MIKPLSEVFSDGTLVDNTLHEVHGGILTPSGGREAVTIQEGNCEKKTHRAWRFLLKTSAALNESLRPGGESRVVLLTGKDSEYEHNTRDEFICIQEPGNPECFSFSTGNLIGSITDEVDGYGFTLQISSRFGNEFLKYIIADADGFLELPEAGGIQDGSYDWLLIYLWLVKLKKAFRLGLPKAYETRVERLAQPRGRLAPVDYFLNQERARYLCTYREHSYDNETTRLIARTLQHLDSHALLRETHRLNQTFQIATHGRHAEIEDLLATKPVSNPYYIDYNPVITLSKRILHKDLLEVGDRSPTSAFLFDVSMLFEYFVRKLLKRPGVVLHSKNERRWSIPSGLLNDRRSLLPDLVFDLNGATYVFDVKYKSFDFHYGVSREDLFQLHTYLGQISNEHDIAGGGFIYPIRESRWNAYQLGTKQGIISDTIKQGRKTIPFHVAFLKVPEQSGTPSADWPKAFRKAFKVYTEEFVSTLLHRLNNSSKQLRMPPLSSNTN
ncbi:MAG TPA: restriction endonuclease [Verrucomicrobiae bacterium]|nr:restriction endonuclease [Verrucomicrobiae bacterium]